MTGVELHHKRKQPTSTKADDFNTVRPASKQLETDDIYDVPVGIATDRGAKLNQEVRPQQHNTQSPYQLVAF